LVVIVLELWIDFTFGRKICIMGKPKITFFLEALCVFDFINQGLALWLGLGFFFLGRLGFRVVSL